MKKAPRMGERKRLLKKAEKVIEAAAVKFEGSILNILKALNDAIVELDAQAAMKLSNHLRATAGTFGWPLISQGAGFIYLIMEKTDNKGDDFLLVQDIQEKLMNIFSSGFRGEHPKGIVLIKQIYADMEKAGFLDNFESANDL